MTISSLKRIGDLQALLVLLRLCFGLVEAILHPHPHYLPKLPFSTLHPDKVILEAFCPPPFTLLEQERLHLLCPVRTLQVWINKHTLSLPKSWIYCPAFLFLDVYLLMPCLHLIFPAFKKIINVKTVTDPVFLWLLQPVDVCNNILIVCC